MSLNNLTANSSRTNRREGPGPLRKEVKNTTKARDLSMQDAGRQLTYTCHQINSALDACIAATVSPELTGMRGLVLGYIVRTVREGRPLYQRDLEESFHVRRSSVTALLKAMERAGFITRSAVEQDARLKSLEPTAKGLACFEHLERCILSFEQQLREDITADDLSALVSILHRMSRNAGEAKARLTGPAPLTPNSTHKE